MSQITSKAFRYIQSRWVWLATCCIITLLSYSFFWSGDPQKHSKYRMSAVERGDLLVEISATGTVEPEEVIDIGAQVAGQIVEFGKDSSGKTIDYGSQISQGMLLARIDESLYQTDLAQAQAQLKKAQADLGAFQAKLLQADKDWKRAQKLGPSDALSASAYDSYESAYQSAKANVVVGEAAITQAGALVAKAQRNLEYCVIRSPVDGVVIDRKVNIGQTVVSSLNAPSLFLIAKDLRRMDVWLAVNEADVGKVFVGQQVSFTVDAFPGETFFAEVRRLRLNASMTQNVVSYIVEVATDNSSGKLLPYLTANARFEVANRHDAMLIPNAALRFTPASAKDQSDSNQDHSSVWIFKDGEAQKVSVTKKFSDGVRTEIESSQLSVGDQVIVAEQLDEQSGNANRNNTNPFAPTMPRGAGRR